jgi:hypothetical protein
MYVLTSLILSAVLKNCLMSQNWNRWYITLTARRIQNITATKMQTHVNAPKFATHSFVGNTASLREIFWWAVELLTLSLETKTDLKYTDLVTPSQQCCKCYLHITHLDVTNNKQLAFIMNQCAYNCNYSLFKIFNPPPPPTHICTCRCIHIHTNFKAKLKLSCYMDVKCCPWLKN